MLEPRYVPCITIIVQFTGHVSGRSWWIDSYSWIEANVPDSSSGWEIGGCISEIPSLGEAYKRYG